MVRSKMKAATKRMNFHLGDRVRLNMGFQKLVGVIVEERGGIGVGGRYLYQITIPMDPFEPMTVELPEDDLEAVPADEQPEPLSKESIVTFLVNYGLLSILSSNLTGGKNQPRVWLCRNNLGNITYTFDPDRGMVGGQTIPFMVMRNDRIFEPKQDVVASFVESFGLEPDEAKTVVTDSIKARR